MTGAIRYSLTAICVAVSITWLALWWRNASNRYRFTMYQVTYVSGTSEFNLKVLFGKAIVGAHQRDVFTPAQKGWYFRGLLLDDRHLTRFQEDIKRHGVFGLGPRAGSVYFPIWYPALILALTGVGVLRFRRQFSIRSALICVSVVALLLGMIVAL